MTRERDFAHQLPSHPFIRLDALVPNVTQLEATKYKKTWITFALNKYFHLIPIISSYISIILLSESSKLKLDFFASIIHCFHTKNCNKNIEFQIELKIVFKLKFFDSLLMHLFKLIVI